MPNNIELQRRWNEKSIAISGVIVFLFLIIADVYLGRANFVTYLNVLYLLIAIWFVRLNFTKSAAKIIDDKLYLFSYLIGKPLILDINEIQSIERKNGEVPVWRVSPLLFNLKNGNKVTFSVGANEGKMKHVIRFIEDNTPLIINKIN